MPDYLVESYQPARDAGPPALGEADVRLVRSVYVPVDEVCLYVFAAPSAEAVRAALEGAAFAYERISEAVSIETEER